MRMAMLCACAARPATRMPLQQQVSVYFTYAVSTTISMDTLTNAPFPAVTVCNMNPLRKQFLAQLYPDIMDELNMFGQMLANTSVGISGESAIFTNTLFQPSCPTDLA